MKATTKNLLIAQNYSNGAKQMVVDDSDLHGKKINKVWDDATDSQKAVEDLYYSKTVFLERAMKSAKKEKIKVFYDPYEGCVYFEMPYGQCSFHTNQDITDNVIEQDDYKWTGLDNTNSLLEEAYNDLFN